MSALGEVLEEYLATRRALGFKLERHGQLLASFVAFMDETGRTAITMASATTWASLPKGADPSWWGARLGAVRCFARFCSAFDPATEVPPKDVLPARSKRAEPYLFSDSELAAVLAATETIRSPLKAATYRTLIGLLAVTGMRVGEAIALDREDVDLAAGVLSVRGAKFNKSREIVLHTSTSAALARYDALRATSLPCPSSPAFFVSTSGTRLIYNNVGNGWSRLVRAAGIAPRSKRCRPRIHDLRHRFAVSTLLRFYAEDGEVEARLPLLSTYLGHRSPKDTYWYLTAVPELLGLAALRLEAAEGSRR